MYFDLPAALAALLHGSAAIDADVAHRVALQGTWLDSLWKLNIAMEHGFVGDLPIKQGDFHGFSIATVKFPKGIV